ncbi:MAG: PilT/PilU family type 4a pilus ATPase [Planctomycetes bacterium]|nr:PilT/PilU family type 4a pilus ATPase [Planctomycetota bacterium]
MEQEKDIHKLFKLMHKYNASDLHLKVGSQPLMRIKGLIREVELTTLSGEDIQRLVYDILTEKQIHEFETSHDLDFAYSLPGVGRFRLNVFKQRGTLSVAARKVNVRIPSFLELNLPPVLEAIAKLQQGLVLVCGITGSGKSTTLASMIEYINMTRRAHIITIEDPIEYLYRDKKSFVNQREIGIDCTDFKRALKYVVRQDPDVILVGEMRDEETFQTGLTAAETGHLVFGTMHSSNVSQTIGRILDLFEPTRHSLLRQTLGFNLKAIVCQKLLPAIQEGMDRVPCVEVMVNNPTIGKLLNAGEDGKISDVMAQGGEEGMIDFNQSIEQLIRKQLISQKVGFAHAPNPQRLRMSLEGIRTGDDRRILGAIG